MTVSVLDLSLFRNGTTQDKRDVGVGHPPRYPATTLRDYSVTRFATGAGPQNQASAS